MNTKNLGMLVFLAVLVVAVVFISGCVQQETTKPTPPAPGPGETTPTEQPTVQKQEEKTVTEQPTETLSEILGRGAGISSVKYDMVTTAPGEPSTTLKIWSKKNKMRTETTIEGQTIVYLIDEDAKTMYMYIPAENIATKIDFAEAPEPPTKSIEGYKPVVIGTEIVDGKVCIVYEVTREGVKTKLWVWKEKGFPVRVEAMTPEGKVITEYKNIEFVDIPDSMFELPAGVQIMEIPTGPGGGPGMPGGESGMPNNVSNMPEDE